MGEIGLITLELSVPPSENRYRRWVPGCAHPLISHDGRMYQEHVRSVFRQSGQESIHGKVAVRVDFYPPDSRRRDLDNLFKCLLDSLVKAHCIDDDSDIMLIHACKCMPIDGGRVAVQIKPWRCTHV